MKYRLLDILCCPECAGIFHLDVYKVENRDLHVKFLSSVRCRHGCALYQSALHEKDHQVCINCYTKEIIEGKLACDACGNLYPIIKGVPRILAKPLLAESLATYHMDFRERYRNEFTALPIMQEGRDKKKLDTFHAFSYQWTTFVSNFDYFRDIFLSFVHPFLGPEDFKDRLVLEVGCGSGRPASVAATFGAEIIGIDLSEAVQTAYSLTQRYPLLHVVQSDAYALPFRPCFDFVYSVGVIHHLPDPAQALRSILKVLPPGNRLVIWVYGIREIWYKPVDWMRKITARLPFRMLHGLSILLAILSEIFLLTPYRILSSIPFTKNLAEKIPGRIYARFPFRENIVGWFDRLGAPVTNYFSKADVENMFKNANFREIKVSTRPGASASWVAQAKRPDENSQRD